MFKSTRLIIVALVGLSVLVIPVLVSAQAATPTFGSASSVADYDGNSTASLNFSQTSLTDGYIVVGVSMYSPTATVGISSVLYDGVSMTFLGTIQSTNAYTEVHLFGLAVGNKVSGNYTVVVTGSSAIPQLVFGVSSFSGVNQTTSVGAFASAMGWDTNPSVSVNSSSGDLVVDILGHDSGSSSLGAGQTQNWKQEDNTDQTDGLSSREIASGANTVMSHTKTVSAPWSIGAIALKGGGAAVPDTTPPSIPGNLSATAVSTSQINLSWSASSDNVGVTGYRIFRNGVLLTTTTSVSYSNTGLSPSTTYTYQVEAFDAAGNLSGLSAVVQATTPDVPPVDTTPPSTPSGVSVVPFSPSQINLSWSASTDNVGVTEYRVFRCQGSGCTPGTLLTTVTGTSYQDSGLTANTAYSYSLVAADAAGNLSGTSAIVSATTQSLPTGETVPFTTIIIDASNSGDDKALADFDLDGDMDPVIGGNNLTWYESQPSRVFTARVIRSTPIFAEFTTDMQTGDVDGDGDPDIIFADNNGNNNVMWYENPKLNPPPGKNADPKVGSNWDYHTIGTHGSWAHDIEVGDINADGKLDVVTSGNNATHVWMQNTPTSWTDRVITAQAGQGVFLGDIDRDGDLDIAVPGGWLETPSNAMTGSWTSRPITGSAGEEVMLADFNGDARLDLMVVVNSHALGEVSWFEAPATPTSSSWTKRIIDASDGAHHPEPADFNNDGLVDILMGLELAPWNIYLNQGGTIPTFLKQQIDTLSGHNARAGDIDGDGDTDIFSSDWIGHPPTKVYMNDGQFALPINQWTYKQVTSSHQQTFGLTFANINADGITDIVSGQYWYRNPGGDMLGSWTQSALPAGMHAILASDVDGDSLADVIAQKNETNLSIYWLEATDSTGSSWNSVLAGSVPTASHELGSQGYRVADVVSGGRPEILVTSGNGIYYFSIPASPQSGNWPRTQVNVNPSDEGLAVGDIDRDGDLDIAATTGNVKTVEWYRNPGNGTANWTAYTLGAVTEVLYPDRIEIADLNGDNRLDVIVSEENGVSSGAQTFWWQAPTDPTNLNWPRTLIVSQGTTNSMDTADMDNDGDSDIILGEHRGSMKVSIWQNSGGVFAETVVDTGKESHLGAQTVDLDGDTDLDIVSIAYDAPQNIHLWRNDAVTSGGTPVDTVVPSSPETLSTTPVSTSQINLSWSPSTDNVAVAGYHVFRDSAFLGTTAQTTYQDLSLAPATLYSYAIFAYDAAGNISLSSPVSATSTFPIPPADTEAPTVAITAPADSATVSGSATAVSASATDNVAVVGVRFLLDGANLGSEDTASPYGVTWNTRTASNGSHTLVAVARDAVGNVSTSTSVSVTVDNDLTAPSVSIIYPINGTTATGTISVSASASDNLAVSGVRFYLDGASLGSEDTTAPYSTVWNTASSANGAHTLLAVARDAAGNSATSTAVSVTVSNIVLPAGTVAAFNFNENSGTTAFDLSTQANNGLVSGAAWVPGKNGSALSFDGLDDFVRVADAASLDLTNGMTLEAWVKPTVAPAGWRTLIAKERTDGVAYYLYASNRGTNVPTMGAYIANVERNLSGGSRLTAGTWTHIAATFNGSVLRLYVNGVQVASQNRSGAAATSNLPLWIGGNNAFGEYFNGVIDEVRIYNRALTAAEIVTDMNTGL